MQTIDEKYELNDIVQFKLMVESLPKLLTSEVYIKLSLLYSTLYGYQEGFNPSVDAAEELILKLESLETGTFNYFEAEFTDNYASSLSFTLFAMITHFKLYPYRMREEVLTEEDKERKKEK